MHCSLRAGTKRFDVKVANSGAPFTVQMSVAAAAAEEDKCSRVVEVRAEDKSCFNVLVVDQGRSLYISPDGGLPRDGSAGAVVYHGALADVDPEYMVEAATFDRGPIEGPYTTVSPADAAAALKASRVLAPYWRVTVPVDAVVRHVDLKRSAHIVGVSLHYKLVATTVQLVYNKKAMFEYYRLALLERGNDKQAVIDTVAPFQPPQYLEYQSEPISSLEHAERAARLTRVARQHVAEERERQHHGPPTLAGPSFPQFIGRAHAVGARERPGECAGRNQFYTRERERRQQPAPGIPSTRPTWPSLVDSISRSVHDMEVATTARLERDEGQTASLHRHQ